ncbi:MAG: hypothetical protein HEQ39_10025 [Rhizobacter sp.]
MSLKKYTKQPIDREDIDFDFSSYLEKRNDLIQTVAVTAEDGLTVEAVSHSEGVVKAWVSGGEDGEQYKVSATVTTVGGRVKQGDLIIRVKEL